jgi:hypothetical protein
MLGRKQSILGRGNSILDVSCIDPDRGGTYLDLSESCLDLSETCLDLSASVLDVF